MGWILDKLNIETCLANRVALAPYLDPKRFHWVFFVDSFLFPFDNHDAIAKNGDMAVYIPLQEKVLSATRSRKMSPACPPILPATKLSSAKPLPTIRKRVPSP